MAIASTANTKNEAPDRERLRRLKAQPRQPGEASFFWYEPAFRCEAVKVLPGEYFVDDQEIAIMTTLGSCIAACLWDRKSGIGGLNHFMLPGGVGVGDSGRYGAYAMELLINEMMKRGALRASLEAKVFGGGQVIKGMDTINIGERNTRFVLDYLHAEGIPIVSKDVLDVFPRKVCFLPVGGRAMVKRLSSSNIATIVARERAAAKQIVPTSADRKAVELF